MSRNSNREGARSFSPMQRRACIVLACCALALILTIVGVTLLFGSAGSSKSSYDPAAYPVDTGLGAVLTSSGETDTAYLSGTVFIGDQNTVNLCDLGLITLNQYMGADGLSVKDVISKACVNFAGDANSYTIPQAIAMMKPRRVVVTLGANDLSGSLTVDSFIQDYRQALNALSQAYSYCDILVASVPPVAKSAENSAAAQTLADQFNQELAKLCDGAGYKFLNTAELLKEKSGYADSSYLEAGAWNKSGGNTFLQYVRTHQYTAEDRRPDTNDVPQRAAQAAAGSGTEAAPTPSPTPTVVTASYRVEEGKGTLTGNGQNGVASLDIQAAPQATVSVTAVAAEGYAFYKWSDGQTSETRYDVITQDISVTAMFNDARVTLTLDKTEATMNTGESITVNATVKLGDKTYDNSGVQWAVNGDMQQTAGSFTYTASAAGTYTIRAGIEINGTYASADLNITVNGPATAVTITGAASIPVGSGTTLAATVTNGSGDTTWTCDQKSDWVATGTQVQFSAASVGSYTVRATNNGISAEFVINVTEAAPTPAPTPESTQEPVPELPVEPAA